MHRDLEKSEGIDPCYMLISLSIFQNSIEELESSSRCSCEQYPGKQMLHVVLQIKETMAVAKYDSFTESLFRFHGILGFLEEDRGILQSHYCFSLGLHFEMLYHSLETS